MVLCLRHGRVGRCQLYYENSKFTKIFEKRDLNSKLVKRRGKVYIINKKILNSKLVKDKMDDKENRELMLALQSLFFGGHFWLY